MSPQQAFAALQRLGPEQALAYLRQRNQITQTWSWADLRADEHAHQFTISRLASVDLLQQLRGLIVSSVDGQLSRTDFLRDAKAALAAKGWWGDITTIDAATGREVTTTFNPSRLKMIYDVNVRQAHAVAQWQRIEDSRESHPYLRYITKDDLRVREQHRSWHDLTLPVGHPFWRTHFPPNGYRCRCRVTQVSQHDYDMGTTPTGAPMRKVAPALQERDWINPRTGEIQRVPLGIDPGFANNPGMARARALRQLVQEKVAALDGPLAKAAQSIGLQGPVIAKALPGQSTWKTLGMPDLRALPAAPAPALLPAADTLNEAVQTLRSALGIEPGGSISVDTPAGTVAIRDASLAHVVEKRLDRRERYAAMVLPTLTEPTEVWATTYDDGSYRHRYIKLFRGTKYDVLVVVMVQPDGSIFWNMLQGERKRLNDMRVGVPIYKKVHGAGD